MACPWHAPGQGERYLLGQQMKGLFLWSSVLVKETRMQCVSRGDGSPLLLLRKERHGLYGRAGGVHA